MIFLVPYKNLNCAVDKTIDSGLTTCIDFNTNDRIILLMILFITSWWKLFEIDPSREIYVPMPFA